jgi:hypothetical protein
VLVGRRAEAAGDTQAALEDVGDVVLASLRLAWVQVLLADGDDDVVVTTRGAAPVSAERCIDQPLVHLGVRVGVLRVAPRLGEALGRRDHALLADLAPAVAAVGATVLAGERLQRSQQHLVTAVEEERTATDDLHDAGRPRARGARSVLDVMLPLEPT